MPGATRSIVIHAPPEKVFSVITHYESYAQFLPEVRKVSVSGRSGSEVDVHYEVDVIKTIRYTLHMKEQAPNRVEWSFVKGEMMKDNKGHWLLEQVPEGTRATYQIEMALGALVPKTVVNALVDNQLPKMLEAFKKRVEST